MTDSFDWSAHNPDVTASPGRGIAAYDNALGTITLRLTDGLEEDLCIALSDFEAKAIIKALRQVVK